VCTTLLDRTAGLTTELVENSRPLSSAELDRYAAAFAELASQAALVVLSGSLPQGTPADYFHRLMQPLRVPVLLDIRGPELKACLPLRPWLVKPNREELAATVGRPLITDADLQTAFRELHAAGAQHIVVSDGPGTLWASGPDGIAEFTPPRVHVVNPIGCGDCLAAGLAAAHWTGRSFHDSVECGIAAAAENAQSLYPGRLQSTIVR
jgi:fructose-1-phosphate kinase PfkB-like protein